MKLPEMSMQASAAPRVGVHDAMSLGRLDAHDQMALLRSKELSAAELIEAAIVRIEKLDPQLNAISYRTFEAARERAAGVPYLLKEGIDYPGMPTRSASRTRENAAFVTTSFEYTRQLDQAGLTPLGKTNAPEFGLLPSTESLLYGPARNPWSLQHSPGGSSGGSAVAVASGMVPIAHAADGGGSIRIPAACCGVFGLKPSRGANVRARDLHFVEDLLVGDSLIARSVRDAAWAFALTLPDGYPPLELQRPIKRLRVALSLHTLRGDMPHPEVAQAIRRTADLCATLGHHVEEKKLPIEGQNVAAAFRTVWGYLAHDVVSRHGGVDSPDRRLEPWTVDLARWSRSLTVQNLNAVFEQIHRASVDFGVVFDDYDVVLSPVLKEPPVTLGRLAPTRAFPELADDMFEYVSYTPLHNLSGTPAMSVPLFFSSTGLPIGSMFAARRGDDALLLRLAAELEDASGWKSRWPKHSVVNLT